MKIGVLALQGAFAEHEKVLTALGAEVKEIRQLRDFDDGFDGIIIPGGESTVMGKLLRELGLFEPVSEYIKNGGYCFGTCAGLILLAEEVSNDDRKNFCTLPVRVKKKRLRQTAWKLFMQGRFCGQGNNPGIYKSSLYRKGA